MQLKTSGLAAGALSVLVLTAVPAGAVAAPVTSDLRIEGAQRTYFEGRVTTDVRTLDGRDGSGPHDCGTTPTVGGLLGTAAETAPFSLVARYYPDFGNEFFLETVEGETPDFDATSTYWSLFDDGVATQTGMCGTAVQGGDEIVFAVTDGDDPLLALSAADTARPGETVELTVTDRADGQPVAGAAVGGQTTGADGKARVTATQRGTTAYKATMPGTIRSESEPVCVTDGQDGFCGTRRPDGTTVTPGPSSTPGSTGSTTTTNPTTTPTTTPPATRDTRRPVGRVAGVRTGQRFTVARAPRELRVTATDASGVAQVKLRLTRRLNGRCAYLSGRKERFVPAKCGRSFAFKASDRGDFSYLLPERLAPGRYVLDVVAIDRAGNRDELARGRSRIVFTVR